MTTDPHSGRSPGGDDSAADLDEFLGRAVERQIAEQRALRETLTALTQAVNALSAPGARLDPDDLADRVRAAVRSAVDPLIGEVRTIGDDIAQKVKGSAPAPEASAAGADDFARLREGVETVSADIEGIAQALIDLNAGLRDWATGVDASIAAIRDTVERARDAPEAPPGGEQIVEAEPVVVASPTDLDQRIKETVELSLWLADQIEEFDRVLSGMSDLPGKLEGVVAQGMRRTLAARAKLDSEAASTFEEALELLDSYVDRMSATIDRFADSEQTLRKLGIGQAELASRVDALSDAVHEIARGGGARVPGATAAVPKRKAKPKARKPAPKSRQRKASPREQTD